MKTSTFIGYILTSLAVFLTPIAPLMVVVALAIVIDTFLGLYKAYRTKQTITSHKLSRVAFKVLFYELLIVIMYPIDVYIMDGSIYGISHLLTKGACLLLVFIEALSVDENIKAINNNKGFEFYLKKLLLLFRKGKEAITDMKKKL